MCANNNQQFPNGLEKLTTHIPPLYQMRSTAGWLEFACVKSR